ncbi:hypothetical protein [Desulfobulbus propionicus]|jgi:hypothetical protein
MLPRFFLTLSCLLCLATQGCAQLDLNRHTVGAFFDDLGRSIRQTTRQLTQSVSGQRAPAVKPGKRLGLKVLKSSLTPTRVRQGDQIKVLFRYSIAGAPSQGVELREKSTLIREGKVLSVLKDDTVTRENGVWENTLTFTVPHSARTGAYTVKLRISAQGLSRTVQRSFTVQ